MENCVTGGQEKDEEAGKLNFKATQCSARI
jgi:hypothetical protein